MPDHSWTLSLGVLSRSGQGLDAKIFAEEKGKCSSHGDWSLIKSPVTQDY